MRNSKKITLWIGVTLLFIITLVFIAISLSVKKDVSKPIDPALEATLPPDPGEAGKATLEGIDSDGDGVRDDVQRYIVLTYPESEKTRAALTQYVVAAQQKILDAASPESSIAHAKNEDARDCLLFIYSNDMNTAIDIIRNVQRKLLNTLDRVEASDLYDSHLSGQTFTATLPSDRIQKCDFDPDLLEN